MNEAKIHERLDGVKQNLNSLDKLLDQYLKFVGPERGLTPSIVKEAKGRIGKALESLELACKL